MRIRPATSTDLPVIAEVYGEQARHGIATFDTEPKPLGFWEARLAEVGARRHVLVAVDDDDRVQGYATSGTYRPRPAYDQTCETSVYARADTRGRGVGRALYDDLLARLRADDVHLVVAVVALPNDASRALHLASGFESVGVLREVGRKFDRWIDTELFQLRLR